MVLTYFDIFFSQNHYSDVIMGAMASQITCVSSAYSTVCYQWKHQSCGLCEGNSPVTGEFPSRRVSNHLMTSPWYSDLSSRRTNPSVTGGRPIWQWILMNKDVDISIKYNWWYLYCVWKRSVYIVSCLQDYPRTHIKQPKMSKDDSFIPVFVVINV